MDYCNSLFINMSKANINKLQKVRLVVRKRKWESISETIRDLHWLRIESRTMFKILLLVYKSIKGNSPKSIKFEFKQKNCRSEDFLKLKICFRNTTHERRTFAYNAPRLWNALPLQIRTEESLDSFKKAVKTLLFQHTDRFKAKAYNITETLKCNCPMSCSSLHV